MSDPVMRRLLWASAAFNVIGALTFAFPASMGQLMGLPNAVPPIYSLLVATFVLLFGGAYAWLAWHQPTIDRPMVAFSAIGKAMAFAIMAACGLAGELPARGVLLGSGDAVFAALFAWWLSTP